MNVIIINGKRIVSDGGDIDCVGGQILVDGKVVHEKEGYILRIVIESMENESMENKTFPINVNSDKAVTVRGNVQGNVDAGGSVSCNNVIGNVKAGGSCSCDDVNGSVTAGGSVNCDNVGGKINRG